MDNEKIFLDGIDEKNVTRELWQELNKIYSKVAHLVNFKYHLMIYRLMKKGYVKPEHMQEVTGFSRQRLYQIISQFERREIERQAENEQDQS